MFCCGCSYYCNGSTILPNPPETICPVGNYCPEGSYEPEPCPRGTIADAVGNSEPDDCEPCPAGQYCTPASSQVGATDPCDPGYVCTGGSDTPTPTDISIGYQCPEGHFCVEASIVEVPCDRGTYAPFPGMSKSNDLDSDL